MNLDEIKNKLVSSDQKYAGAYNYIVTYRPKFIVEYGGGESTFYLTELVNSLNYGGKVVGYESNPTWFQRHSNSGWNKHGNIFLVDIDHIPYLDKFYVVRYKHLLEDIEGVDFIIIDGPDLTQYDPYPIATINLLDAIEGFNREIPYFIDGRRGTRDFYRSRLNQNLEIEDTKLAH